MRKITLTLVTLLMVTTCAFAQISDGEPNYTTIPRTGNRPTKGTAGLYLGASVSQIIDLVKYNTGDNVYWALPVINAKYYFSDNWEGRIGFEFACQSSNKNLTFEEESYTTKTDYNFTRFLPGAAYHFNTRNILDVYVGAQVPIGFNLNNTSEIMSKTSVVTNQNSFIIGAGVFMGLQIFIADIPFAIGLEGGYSGYALIGGDQKTTVDNEGTKTVYVDQQVVKDASSTNFHWGADAAITFSYYFNR